MGSKAANRRKRRSARQRARKHALLPEPVEDIDHDHAIYLVVTSSAERLFKLCQARPYRKTKTRPLRLVSECGYKGRARTTMRACQYDGVMTAFRKDRREKTPYTRDFYGPKQRKAPKDRKVTSGECVPIDTSKEHYFDHVDDHRVPEM